MSSEQPATEVVAPGTETDAGVGAVPAPKAGRGISRWLLLIAAVVVLDIAAFVLFPPFPKGAPGESCAYPGLLHREQPGIPGAGRGHRLRARERARRPRT